MGCPALPGSPDGSRLGVLESLPPSLGFLSLPAFFPTAVAEGGLLPPVLAGVLIGADTDRASGVGVLVALAAPARGALPLPFDSGSRLLPLVAAPSARGASASSSFCSTPAK